MNCCLNILLALKWHHPHCMFQRVLLGAHPATHRQNAQVVKMASTKLTTLVQVNGDMSLTACVYDY